MTNEQKQVKDWMQAFGQETPERPVIPSLEVRKFRAKLILEEALETISKGLGLQVCIEIPTIGYDGGITGYLDDEKNGGIFKLAGFEEHPVIEPNLTEIADGCADLKVVTEGTLVACGLIDPAYERLDDRKEGDPLFDEVMRSNWSKFWSESECHSRPDLPFPCGMGDVKRTKYVMKDSNGKVIKPPSYTPPDLQPIIDEMSKQ